MSLELDISELQETFTLDLNEGFAKAKRDFVDTRKMTLRQLKALAELDPTPPDKKKYIEWMARMYADEGHRNTRLYADMAEFDKLLKDGKIEQRDINQYRSPEEVTNAVHAAHMRIGEESRQKKEQDVKAALLDFQGSTERAYKYLNGKRLIRDAEGHVTGVDETIPEYVTREFVEDVRKRMQSQKEGEGWKDFTIDEGIFDLIDPKDVIRDNQYVTIVEPKSEAKSQLYGRNMWYDPNDPHSKTSFWCTSYAKGCAWSRYAFYQDNINTSASDRFYIILPKSASIVPKKDWAKLNVQVHAEGNRYGDRQRKVWDTNDGVMKPEDVIKLFKSWDIPWPEGEKEEEET